MRVNVTKKTLAWVLAFVMAVSAVAYVNVYAEEIERAYVTISASADGDEGQENENAQDEYPPCGGQVEDDLLFDLITLTPEIAFDEEGNPIVVHPDDDMYGEEAVAEEEEDQDQEFDDDFLFDLITLTPEIDFDEDGNAVVIHPEVPWVEVEEVDENEEVEETPWVEEVEVPEVQMPISRAFDVDFDFEDSEALTFTVSNATEFANALNTTQPLNVVINLATDITANAFTVHNFQPITINTNGHTLNVPVSQINGNSTLNITGNGTVNIDTVIVQNSSLILGHDAQLNTGRISASGGNVTVTSVNAEGWNHTFTFLYGVAVQALNGATVTVREDITTTGLLRPISARGSMEVIDTGEEWPIYTRVNVLGNIVSTGSDLGIEAQDWAIVTVGTWIEELDTWLNGDVNFIDMVDHDTLNSARAAAIHSTNNSTIAIHGDLTITLAGEDEDEDEVADEGVATAPTTPTTPTTPTMPVTPPPTTPTAPATGGGGGTVTFTGSGLTRSGANANVEVVQSSISLSNTTLALPARLAESNARLVITPTMLTRLVNTAEDMTVSLNFYAHEDITSVTVPRTTLARLASLGLSLEIVFRGETITLSADMLRAIVAQSRNQGNIAISSEDLL